MNLEILDKKINTDNSYTYLVQIPKKEYMYLGYFLEGFEGLCNFSTSDKNNSIMRIEVTEDFEKMMDEVLNYLDEWSFETIDKY